MRHAQSGQGCAARDGAYLLRVFAGEHGDYALVRGCLFSVDRTNPGRGVRAAHDRRVVHARHLDVVDVGGRSGDEARVFAPPDTLSNESFGFGNCGRHIAYTPAAFAAALTAFTMCW